MLIVYCLLANKFSFFSNCLAIFIKSTTRLLYIEQMVWAPSCSPLQELLGARPIRSNRVVPYFYYRRQSHEKGSEQWKNRIAAGIGSNSQIRGHRPLQTRLAEIIELGAVAGRTGARLFANPPLSLTRQITLSPPRTQFPQLKPTALRLFFLPSGGGECDEPKTFFVQWAQCIFCATYTVPLCAAVAAASLHSAILWYTPTCEGGWEPLSLIISLSYQSIYHQLTRRHSPSLFIPLNTN